MIRIKLFIVIVASLIFGYKVYAQRAPAVLFSPESIEQINIDIRNDMYGKISSLVIYFENRIIYERYYGFSQANTLHPISSVTKSITSMAVGVCIDNGIIPSLDVKIADYFPEYSEIFEKDSRQKDITLRHLLTQTSGF